MVARLLSFSRAALELNVSQSAVSHQIRLLEDFLGAAAAAPGAAALLTPQGRSGFEGIAAGLVQIAQSSEQLRGGGEMRVRLAVYQLLCGEVADPAPGRAAPASSRAGSQPGDGGGRSRALRQGGGRFHHRLPEGPRYLHDLLYRGV